MRKPSQDQCNANLVARRACRLEGNGDITIGAVGPIRCAATAADEVQCLAMLVRRPGESLSELLQRLDAAIADACQNNVFVDEVNAPPTNGPRPSRRSRA